MKEKRKGWPRWAKILRNLLLAVLLGVMIWDLWDQPSFTYAMDLRRRERQMLVPEPEAVAEFNISGGMKYRVELTDDMAVTSYPAHGDFFTVANTSVLLLEEGPNLICISRFVELPDEAGQPMSYAAYAAAHPPEDAVSATLTLHSDGWDSDTAVEGIQEGELFLFYLRSEQQDKSIFLHVTGPRFTIEGVTYQLEFFDKDGRSICQVSG